MNRSTNSRKGRVSQNTDKQLLNKLYNQYNFTQHELNKVNSIDHGQKDNVIKDQTFLSSNNQNYTPQQIARAYKFLCNTSSDSLINLSSLAGFLQEQGEKMYTGVQMISFLDRQNKGFVSKQQFFNFFQKGVPGAQAQIPSGMRKDQQLVKSIDKHYDSLLKNFSDPQYCDYAAKEIKRFKYSQQL